MAQSVTMETLPRAGASRWAALGCSAVAFVGLAKLNVQGPGITGTVKSLWKRPEPASSA